MAKTPNRSAHPQLNMRVEQAVIDQLDRVKALLEQKHGLPYKRVDAVRFAAQAAERELTAGQDAAKPRPRSKS